MVLMKTNEIWGVEKAGTLCSFFFVFCTTSFYFYIERETPNKLMKSEFFKSLLVFNGGSEHENMDWKH